jgi:hypothetical protein
MARMGPAAGRVTRPAVGWPASLPRHVVTPAPTSRGGPEPRQRSQRCSIAEANPSARHPRGRRRGGVQPRWLSRAHAWSPGQPERPAARVGATRRDRAPELAGRVDVASNSPSGVAAAPCGDALLQRRGRPPGPRRSSVCQRADEWAVRVLPGPPGLARSKVPRRLRRLVVARPAAEPRSVSRTTLSGAASAWPSALRRHRKRAASLRGPPRACTGVSGARSTTHREAGAPSRNLAASTGPLRQVGRKGRLPQARRVRSRGRRPRSRRSDRRSP